MAPFFMIKVFGDIISLESLLLDYLSSIISKAPHFRKGEGLYCVNHHPFSLG